MPADNPETKEQCLARGSELADKIKTQTARCTVALSNRDEARRLESLQRDFVEWEISATAAGINLQKEFGEQLKVLRPAPPVLPPFNLRGILTAEDLWNIETERLEQRKRKDSSMALEDWP